MRPGLRIALIVAGSFLFSQSLFGQAGEVCGDMGGGASVWLNSRVVYGTVKLIGVDDPSKAPKVTVSVVNGARVLGSMVVDKAGTFCFRDVDGSGSTVIVEVEGREVGREILETSSGTMPRQFRRDFEIQVGNNSARSKPGVISAKYPYQRNEQNSKLYAESEALIQAKDFKGAERSLRKIVEADKNDFWAWAKLGTTYLELNDLPNAEKTLKQSLVVNSIFVPAMVSLGRTYLMEKQFDSAIDVLVPATKAEPNAARAFQLLGEAYLMVKKGTLGVEALYRAIELEPVAMAESHLLIALLYDRAGAKSYASREYKLFLEKKPDHPDAKKFAKYVQDNPPEP